MGETIWLGEVALWGVGALIAFGAGVWIMFTESEFGDVLHLLLNWGAALALLIGMWALMFLGWVPSAFHPFLALIYPAGLLGAGLGMIVGCLWHR